MTGTAHLIAVSGSHLAIVGFVIEGLLQKTRCSRGLQRAILAITLVGYAAFTSASPSAVRACCMVFVTLVVNGAGRRRHGLSALFVTISIFVLLRPTVLFEMGFQLSCASVFAILCFCPYATYALGELGVPSGIAGMLSVTLWLAVGDAPHYHSCLRYVLAHCSVGKCGHRSGGERTGSLCRSRWLPFRSWDRCGLGRSLCP